ncbi:MAG: ABC transporter permease subunit [Leptospiraceae bacterium]|nr:ABC transporter permease subunit [Leptospiraceae bacterium]MCZ8347630.1 ABC transporter permease subunit [Leptospiraceae bacterium]
MAKEFFRFLIFFLFLSLLSLALVRLRVVDKAYQYTDSGLSEDTIKELSSKTSFSEDFFDLYAYLFLIKEGKTESGENVLSHLADRILPTLQISILAILFGVITSILFSMYFLDSPKLLSATDFISKFILSTPIFIFSLFLLIFFFYKWEILPPGGYKFGSISYLILPSLSLGVRVYARLQLFLSSQARIELESPLFKLLETRGIPRNTILFKNLFPKLLPTFIVLVILDLGSLLSGAMVVEEIFFFPGIGRSLFYAIKSMDQVLLSILLVYSGSIIYLMNRTALLYQDSRNALLVGREK